VLLLPVQIPANMQLASDLRVIPALEKSLLSQSLGCRRVWARAYYQQQRARGSDHHAAVRALAFKWIRIVFRCWKSRVAYDESKFLAALAKRGSPLGKLALVGMGTGL